MNNLWRIRTFLPSLIFNLRHLPLRQALHLPIIIHKARILNCTGKFVFDCPVKYGLVQLGKDLVCIYPHSGITLENAGEIIFKGKVLIGNNSAISVGKSGKLTLGNNVAATTTLKLACYHSISLGDDVLIGWDCMFIDTDFHNITRLDGEKVKGYGPIEIGSNTWIANGCKIYKNTVVPDHCVIGADSVLHGCRATKPFSILFTKREYLVKENYAWLDRDNESIDYSGL